MTKHNQQNEWLEFSLILDQDQVGTVSDYLSEIVTSGLVAERIYGGIFPDELDTVIVPVRLYGYIPIDDSIDKTRSAIISTLSELSQDLSLPEPVFTPLKNQNWATAWQVRYEPIPLGERLIIVPSWLENPHPERLQINMDPGMAFGSGTHPTTKLSLIMLEQFLDDFTVPQMIDIGSGSGILSIAGCMLGAERVLGVDNDPEVIRVSSANADRNKVSDKVDFQLGSVAEISSGKFGFKQAPLVVANIITPILTSLFEIGLSGIVSPGGTLLLSGILEEQLPGMVAVINRHQLRVREQRQEGEWIALRVERSSK